MKTTLLTLLCLVALGAGLALAEDQPAGSGAALTSEPCFTLVKNSWGNTECAEKPEAGLSLTVKNTCKTKMSLSLCIERADATWDCFLKEDVPSDEEVTLSSCNNSGNYKMLACSKARDCREKPAAR